MLHTTLGLVLAGALTAGAPLLAPAPAAAAASSASTTLADVAALVGADELWARGLTGRGVDVALVDSGVLPVPGLAEPGKVVHGPDLSLDSPAPGTTSLDGFGHGTHLAGVLAADGGGWRGVAPDARLLNVKVGAANGAVDVSQVIAAIDWVVQHRRDNGLDVRVLTLALGTDSAQSAWIDPLAKAVDTAWRAGIVVVVAVGNDGRSDHRVASPATAPSVIAVGASDAAGSRELSASRPAWFSATGSTRRPDLLAPGARVVSLRAPGSYLDQLHPRARRGVDGFRGSGTSQAGAVVSGAVALLLQQRPELTPDQVKALLVRSGPEVSTARGRALLDVAAAAALATPVDVPAPPVLSGRGSLDAARGSSRLQLDGVELVGERDVFGAPFTSAWWAAGAGRGWDGGSWNGSTWTGDGWSGAAGGSPHGSWASDSWRGGARSGTSWSGGTWNGNTWSGNTWSGNTWSGNTWSGGTWSGNTWSGATWSGGTWSGNTWSANSWSGGTWSGASWG